MMMCIDRAYNVKSISECFEFNKRCFVGIKCFDTNIIQLDVTSLQVIDSELIVNFGNILWTIHASRIETMDFVIMLS